MCLRHLSLAKNSSPVNFFGSVVKLIVSRGDLAAVSAPLASLGAHTECGAVCVYQKRSAHGVWERVAILVAQTHGIALAHALVDLLHYPMVLWWWEQTTIILI